MTAFDDLTWHEAMRKGHGALMGSESLYDDINAKVRLALASELGSQGERYGHPGT
jgi:hypothetical protein